MEEDFPLGIEEKWTRALTDSGMAANNKLDLDFLE
jgi:hypothetical protein